MGIELVVVGEVELGSLSDRVLPLREESVPDLVGVLNVDGTVGGYVVE